MNKGYLKEFIEKELGVDVDDKTLNKFSRFEELLLEWNAKFNLTAIKDEEGILEKHFIDSLYSGKYVDFAGKTLCDIGTGAGFPGIPLAILYSDLNVTLVESNGKKIGFLNLLVDELELENVTVIKSRAEDLKKYRDKFDYVSARSLTQLNILLELSIPLLKVDGRLLAYKIDNNNEEIKNAKNALKVLDAQIESNNLYHLPINNYGRSLLIIKKMSMTKKKYPRPYADISKSPL